MAGKKPRTAHVDKALGKKRKSGVRWKSKKHQKPHSKVGSRRLG
jgi:hypothetical protein